MLRSKKGPTINDEGAYWDSSYFKSTEINDQSGRVRKINHNRNQAELVFFISVKLNPLNYKWKTKNDIEQKIKITRGLKMNHEKKKY